MVIIQDEKVLLFHQSVKDFLDKKEVINDLKAHAELAYRCVDLLIEDFHDKGESHVTFLGYAVEEWANHAHMAQSGFKVKASQGEFFDTESKCRESWLRLYNRGRVYDSIPEHFSVLHVAAKWGILALVDHVCCPYSPLYEAEELVRLIEFAAADDVTPLECAAGSGHSSVITRLLDMGGKVSTRVAIAAAGNWRNGKEVMALLLDRRGDQITITEEVVKAAAGNQQNGKEVMELLLDRRGDQITITEEVVKAAVWNGKNGKEVMTLLLDRRGDQITVTEKVVKAAAWNQKNGKEVMTLLLDRRGDEITINEEVVKAAATCGQDQVLDFLSQQTVRIEEEWRCIAQFYNAAKAGDVQVIEELIRKGIKPDVKNIWSVTPLWIAASVGHNTIVKLLAERRDVDVNSRSVLGASPLFWPASRGDEPIVATLMDAGADPTFMDCDGNTAIMIARKNGHEKIAKMLEGWNNETDAMKKA
ncbi:ankyrin domain protein [Colletotrichum plurivorum]|uniref:Ankyrin domain protein n=1 Tax=Colletotrichum plurivorum TaxID=2175906 RepID=A0A8H6MSR2_9PEZI|nr:ankyrin domain protein [Colletotrichum plurivorum]